MDDYKNELNDQNYILKRFRAAYTISKENYSDDELDQFLKKNENNFEKTFVSLIESQEEKEKIRYKDPNVMKRLIYRFREDYNLQPKDWSDNQIQNAIFKAKGNFDIAFDSLF